MTKETLVDGLIYIIVGIASVLTYMSLGWDFPITVGYIIFGVIGVLLIDKILDDMRL